MGIIFSIIFYKKCPPSYEGFLFFVGVRNLQDSAGPTQAACIIGNMYRIITAWHTFKRNIAVFFGLADMLNGVCKGGIGFRRQDTPVRVRAYGMSSFPEPSSSQKDGS